MVLTGDAEGDIRSFKLAGQDENSGRYITVEPSGEDGVNVRYIYNWIF